MTQRHHKDERNIDNVIVTQDVLRVYEGRRAI